MTPRGLSPLNAHYEMRIADSQEASNINWTKCSKMTEEGHRRHGMNGNTDGGAVAPKEECPRSAYNQGGRLKFFKGNTSVRFAPVTGVSHIYLYF